MSAEMNQSILEDLEIDAEKMIDPTGYEAFSERVLAAAKTLEEILDTNTSVSQVTSKFQKESEQIKEFPEYDDTLTAMYELCESDDLAKAYALIRTLKALTQDLENGVHDKAKKIASQQNATLANKKLAQIQHRRLKDFWNVYRKFVKMFFNTELPLIKGKPGNYESNVFDTYFYRFPDGTEYYSHRAVAKKLGIFYEGIKFADIMEYCEEHEDLIEVTKVVLK